MKPVIVGCRTDCFSDEALASFRAHQPFGMILFDEPCRQGANAVKRVIAQFKNICPHAHIFIDVEGGSVNRLHASYDPSWQELLPARTFGELALKNLQEASDKIFLHAQSIGKILLELGISVNCAPVADLVQKEQVSPDLSKPHATSSNLYQRSFGNDPALVTACVSAFIAGLESAGICAVLKHVPGYGRVEVDPHYQRPLVKTPLTELQNTDFLPFKNLNRARAMMTAHVVYDAIDTENCTTLSKKLITLIRQEIRFSGVLIADSIEMNSIWPEGFSTTEKDQFGMGLPLPETLGFLTRTALKAGCDLIMHSDCSRNFAHTLEILEAAPDLEDTKAAWLMEKMKIPAPTAL
ncbi:MAG: glycoside hydrolase family 3 N-terminal domain-containing protein [Bdellovibrionales bacterium]